MAKTVELTCRITLDVHEDYPIDKTALATALDSAMEVGLECGPDGAFATEELRMLLSIKQATFVY